MVNVQYIIDNNTWTKTTDTSVVKLENDNYILMYDTLSCYYELYQKVEYFLFHPNNKILKKAIIQKGKTNLTT